jgi:hypothetical protein
VIYQGGILGSENQFILDAHHVIERQRVFPVCGNTYRMINETRFKPYFDFQGDWETHFGIFKGCGIDIPFARDNSPRSTLTEGASCGC